MVLREDGLTITLAGGAVTEPRFDEIGHVEVRDRRRVEVIYDQPGEIPPAPLTLESGRLLAEDHFDQLVQQLDAVEGHTHSGICDGRLELSAPSAPPWAGATTRVHLHGDADGEFVFDTGSGRFACRLELPDRPKPEALLTRVDAPGDEALRVFAGRVTNRTGAVVATYETFRSSRRALATGFAVRFVDGPEYLCAPQRRRIYCGNPVATVRPAGDGVEWQFDAAVPEYVGLVIALVDRFVERHGRSAHADHFDQRPEPRATVTFKGTEWVPLGICALAAWQIWRTRSMIAVYFGVTAGLVAAWIQSRVERRDFRIDLNPRSRARLFQHSFQLCLSLGFGVSRAGYHSVGHVLSSGWSGHLLLSPGWIGQAPKTHNLHLAGAEIREFAEHVSTHAPWHVMSIEGADSIEYTRPWAWTDVLPEENLETEIRIRPHGGATPGQVRLVGTHREFVVFGDVVDVADAVGRTAMFHFSRKLIRLDNGMVLARVRRQHRERVVIDPGCDDVLELDAKAGSITRSGVPVGTIHVGDDHFTGLRFTTPMPEVAAAMLAAAMYRSGMVRLG